jgi:hypothetical protein
MQVKDRTGKPMQVTDSSGVLRNQTGIIGGLHHSWVACRHRRSAAKRSVFHNAQSVYGGNIPFFRRSSPNIHICAPQQ